MPEGALFNDATRFDSQYVYSIINSYRAALIAERYRKEHTINPVCYQKFYPEFEKDLQIPENVRFRCPNTINILNEDGFRFLGTVDCSIAFRRIKNRSELSTVNKHSIMKLRRVPVVLYDGNTELLEVYGNKDLKEMLVELIAAEPHAVPTFNFETDQYPLSEDDVPLLEDMIFKANIIASLRTPPDYLQDRITTPQNVR